MGRILLIEEELQDSINRLLSNQKTQVGLILGQVHEAKDFALHFARCPDPVDDEVEIETPCSSDDDVVIVKSKKNTKPQRSIESFELIDLKWVVEHARQVNRMLTGGIVVLGVYMFCTPDILAKNQAKLRQCLQQLQKKTEDNKWVRQSLPHTDRYLIHICASSRKITCRTIDFCDDQASPKPAEYRYQSFLSNWHTVSCFVDVNVKFNVPLSQEASKTEQKVMYACRKEVEDIWNAYATTEYKLVDETQMLENKKPGKGKSKLNTGQNIELLLFKKSNSSNSNRMINYDTANVEVKFVGSLCSKAFLNNKATYGDAVKAIKVDIIRSIFTRIELLCEEAEVNNLDQVDEWSLMSPARVFACFKKSNISFCDYVFKDESEADMIGRFSELLDLDLAQDDLVYLERSPDVSEVSMILRGERVNDQSEIASELSNSCHDAEPYDKKVYLVTTAAVATALFAVVIHFFYSE